MHTHPNRFAGRHALVTGGTKGIGLATVRRLHAEGARVTAVARSQADLDALAADLDDRITTIAADLADEADRDRIVNKVGPSLDILINNAGMNIRKPTADYDAAEIARVMSVNLDACLDLCRRLRPAMLTADETSGIPSAIVNVSSVAAVRSMSTGAPYAASKAALDQLTRYLAVEWAPKTDQAGQTEPGIRVNSVQPAYIDTPLAAPVFQNEARYQQILAARPVGAWWGVMPWRSKTVIKIWAKSA
ncbi:MAG: SDR family NAD(P)-dependent oxidoreductase, partial [Planctomycetota bacterium]